MNFPVGLMANFISITLVLATYQHSGDPRVMVGSFILLAFARFITVEIFCGLHRFFPKTGSFLERFTSKPASNKKPNLVTEKGTNKPTGDWGYFMFLIIPAIMAFTIMTTRQDIPLETYQMEVEWSFIYLGIYWVQDLLGRQTVMNFDESRIYNLAYNMGPVLVLFFAVFVGGIFYSLTQKFLTPSPWFICGPLILIKHLSDFHFGRKRRSGKRLKFGK